MIEFDADHRRNLVEVTMNNDGFDFRSMVNGRDFEDALDTLVDKTFLDDWLRETIKAKVENYFDRTPSMTDDELQRFIEILEAMI